MPAEDSSDSIDRRYRFLDRDDAALLLIDHQVGTMLFGLSDIDILNLLNNVMKLVEGAEILGLPIILSTSNPTAVNGPLFKELTDKLPDTPIINRTRINAWADPDFVRAVEETGRQQLIMAGVTSNVCLTMPAVAASGDGYDVYGVIDASGAPSPHALNAAMFRMSQAGVKIADSGMVLAELLGDWASDEGPQMGQLFATHERNSGLLGEHMQMSQAAA